jgi:drug/metabolite transporter (DMT)-like permease
VVWSFGGLFARLLGPLDVWTVVFWRSGFAAAFLIGFMALRDGPGGLAAGFRAMGAPGLAVALAFASASTSFVVALGHTTVANILLVQAGVPLIAALLAWAAFGERVPRATWAAIALVFVGVAVMVSGSLTGAGSALGDALAVWIAVAFASATVITRRFAQVRMVPAVCLGALLAAGFAASRAPGFAVTGAELGLLAGFGAFSLGLGLALFVTGARLVPAAVAALIGVAETLLGPVWVWLFLDETPDPRTLVGGALVLGALTAHLARSAAAPRRTG